VILTPASVFVDGADRAVRHWFGPSRAIVDYEGVFIFVDRNPDGTWDLSAIPTRADEHEVLDALIKDTLDKTVVKVTSGD
jgi:hypothetical protein